MVYLIADSANVTVLRSVASTAYGNYNLNLPDGINLEDIHSVDAPGNQLGYVSTLTKKRVGRFFRRFIRADVTITAASPSDPFWVAESNVDEVLREAEERVSGDFFLESDISKAGLGAWQPFVDFNVGDIVAVEIWGQVVYLPVTRIEPIISDHGVIDWKVHVGGQLISNDDARIAENKVIYRALIEDRRELVNVSATARTASKKADSAQTTATMAVGETAELREALAGAGATTEDLQEQLEALNQQLQEAGEGTEVQLPLIQAYISANTARWELQQRVDEMQDQMSAELLEQQITMKEEFEADRASRPERIIASAAGSSHPDYPVTVRPDGGWSITLRDVKNAVLMSRVWSVSGEEQSAGGLYQRVSSTNNYTWSVASGLWGSMEWARVPGAVKSVNQDIYETYYLNNANTWYLLDDVHSVKVGASGTDNLDMKVQVGWPDSWGWYRLQIRAGDTVLADVRKEGTSTLFSKGTIYTVATVTNAKIPPNTTVRAHVQRWWQASSRNHRYFRVITRASWTERNT